MLKKIKWLIFIQLFVGLPAWGTVTGFSTCDEGAFCVPSAQVQIGRKVYVKVSGLMEGRVEAGGEDFGPYKAPITVLYPARARDCGGTAMVDLVNNSMTSVFINDLGGLFPYVPPFGIASILLGEPYIASRGLIMASLQYQKIPSAGIDPIGAGIAAGYYPPDANIPAPEGEELLASSVVISDGADFVRNLGSYIDGACDAFTAIGFGYSQSAIHLRQFNFIPEFWGSYDGNISGGNVFPDESGPTPEESGKSITVNSETDVQILQGEKVRGDTDWYKVFEISGTSHAPTEGADLAPIMAAFGLGSRQNPAKVSPVFRSMLEHLVGWIGGGRTPPHSAYLVASSTNPKCQVGSAENLYDIATFPTWNDQYLDCPTLRDPAKGNALPGGVRLPHVATRVGLGWVGAPLGSYGGVEPISPYSLAGTLPNISFAPASAGLYTRFSDLELAQLYGKVQKGKVVDLFSTNYLGAVASAAIYAHVHGWINAEETLDYIKTATECARKKKTSISDAELVACHGVSSLAPPQN